MDYLPEWWELAYTEDGALVGVIMAARNPSSAVIAYVAVVPEQRGHGLAQQLVHRGTERLVNGGSDEIRGDCDRDNIAMVKAFQRAGYEQVARRRTYRHAINGQRVAALRSWPRHGQQTARLLTQLFP
jgi:ribosomal protein S18 acetylase RimI-like enzyme